MPARAPMARPDDQFLCKARWLEGDVPVECREPGKVKSGGYCAVHAGHRQRGQPFRRRQARRYVQWRQLTAEQALAEVALLSTASACGCPVWTGAVTTEGYPKISGPVGRFLHRNIWTWANGPIPAGMTVDHECHNEAAARGECRGGPACPHRRCTDASHWALREVTENTRRSPVAVASINAAATHCPRDHPYDSANTYWYKGHRQCRTCRAAHWRAYKRKRR